MSKKWITILVAAVIGALLLPSAAFAACRLQVVDAISYVDGTNAANNGLDPQPYVAGDKITKVVPTVDAGTGLVVNKEGVAERVADLLITDDAAGTFCFTTGSDLVITYNAILTLPTTPGNLAIPDNLDIFDSNGIGGLTVTSATVTQVFAANTTNSQLDIKIGQTGTAGDLLVGPAGSALRIKNIRLNASKAGATVSATFLGNTGLVGTVTKTVPAPVAPAAIVAGGTGGGVQSSGKGLALPQTVALTEGFGNAFRTKGGTCASRTIASDTCYSQVANDIATVATSLTFSVTGIPSGVTVKFPSSMSTSAVDGADALAFGARSTTLDNGAAAGNLTVTYDTSANTAALLNVMTVETADNPDLGTNIGTTTATSNPNCKISGTPAVLGNLNAGSNCNANPKVGVKVASISGAGTANLWWVFGPGDVGTSQFTGDDVAADTTVIPRYTGSGRVLVSNKPYFTIFPTRTTLLFPFVSTVGKFNTGISVINSCNDAGVFPANGTGSPATCTTEGGVTLFFFGINPDTGAAVTDTLNSDLTTTGSTNLSTACRGLDAATGHVKAGAGMACALSNLLPLLASKPSNFDGYVIAVTGFNFGHGFSAQFNAAGAPFAANSALVIGLNGATGRGTGLGAEGAGN
jgi:hypothetical protein